MAWYEKNEETYTVWTELQTDDGLTYFYNTETKETSWERPEELMSEEDRSRQGEWVWVPDEFECFIPGKVTTRTPTEVNVEADNGELHRFPINTPLEPLKWSSLQRITPDLVLLDSMSLPLILHNLKKRFESGEIYTNIGTICISINPYTFLDPPIYGAQVIKKYRNKLSDHKQMPPHVYCIGDDAFKGLTFKNGLNQSVIISGESGAGKTEAAKQVVNYVSAVAGSTSGIERLLFVSNPILESFGNAKTVRNNNSSRFGKYMEMYFTRDLKLCSAFVTNYLLEKIRVPSPMANERNYHIFYQLCHSSPEMQQEFRLGDPSAFSYLCKGNCVMVDGVDDRADFVETMSAMEQMHFSASEIHDTFQLLAGILHLGNVGMFDGTEGSVEIDCGESFQNAAYYFAVSEDDLFYKLTTRKMIIRGQAPVDVPLKPKEAADARDACAKFIYSHLFDWIVAKINSSMLISSERHKSIGILDIFGFEIFEENSFEQMCINYTNEQLQQIFNFTVFKREEQLYKSENIRFDHVPFIDNEPIIRLIEDRPYGILNLLDEECRVPEGSEAKFLAKVGEAQKNCQYFELAKVGGGRKFTLQHYAGVVTYCVDNFLEKNRDTLTQDLLEMVTNSQLAFLAALFPKQSGRGDAQRKATLGKQFKAQLQTLVKTLNATEPHYIRCIKPNEEKAPLTFVSVNCKEQLTYAGVFEAVQIRKAGYPFHMKHAQFVERYGFLVAPSVQGNASGCRQIMAHFQLDEENIKVGRSMVLYRSNEHRLLELKRSIVVEQRDLEEKLRCILAQDPQTMADPVPYYEELAMMVRKAKRFKLESHTSKMAEQRLDEFIEARIDPQTKALMEEAFLSRDFAQIEYAVSVADSYNYQTKRCKECRKLLFYMRRIREEVAKALNTVERKPLEVCVQAADHSGYYGEEMDKARYLISLDQEKFIQEQLRACVRLKDFNRQVRLEINLKDLVFQRSPDMFRIENFNNLKSAEDWACEKLFGRDKSRENFMKWQKDAIHSTLTKFPSDKNSKKIKKNCLQIFKNIQVFMGDRKPSKNQSFNKKVGLDLLKGCTMTVAYRNEFYLQVIKQVSANPTMGSNKKGWDLLILALNTFPPGDHLKDFLHVYLKDRCAISDKERYLIALQTISLADKSNLTIPSGENYNTIISGKNLRQPQFSDKTLPGKPSWEDLTMNWDEIEDDDDDMLFTASSKISTAPIANIPMPKNTTLNKPQEAKEKVTGWGDTPQKTDPSNISMEYNGPWAEYIDAESGYPYYFNVETEETTWDKPAEMP